jgi:hypothetical protein
LPITLVAVLFAPILPLFAKNGWLPNWLSWFQTPDNPLYGDSTFILNNGGGYLAEVKWLLRNPAYGFGLKYINGFSPMVWYGDRTIKDNAGAIAGWLFVKGGGLFQFTWIYPIGFSRCIYVNFGWNIRALIDPNVSPKPNPYQATFVFSPRLSGFTS